MKLFILLMSMFVILEVIWLTYKRFTGLSQACYLTFFTIITTVLAFFTPFPYNYFWMIPICFYFYLYTKKYSDSPLIIALLLSLINISIILSNLFTTDLWRLLHKYQLLSDSVFTKYNLIVYVLRYLCMTIFIGGIFSFLTKKRLQELFSLIKDKYTLQAIGYLLLLFALNVLRLANIYRGYNGDFFYILGLFLVLAIGGYTFVHLQTIVASQALQNRFLNEKLSSNSESIALADEFKHDYRNILSSLNLYLEQNKTAEALTYVSEVIAYSKPLVDPTNLDQIERIESLPIQSLLLTFLHTAKKQKVAVKYYIQQPISNSEFPMNVIDFIRCLSIFLDNALEATSVSDTPSIQVYFSKIGDQLLVRVVNHCLELPNLESIMTKHYSSKQGHTGIGLYNFKKIVQQYPDTHYQFSTKEQQFIAELMI